MCDAINSGKDLHCFTAQEMFQANYDELVAAKKSKAPTSEQEILLAMRQTVKPIGFGLIYGIGPVSLASQLSDELKREVTKEEAQRNIRKYFNIFPGVEAFIKETHQECHRKEYVQTLLMRKRRLPQINACGGGGQTGEDAKGIVAEARRQSVNTRIQGTAADIAKAAMIRAEYDQELNSVDARLLLQIHDELIWEVEDNPEAVEITKRRAKAIMEHPFGPDFNLRVPLTTEANSGWTWTEAK